MAAPSDFSKFLQLVQHLHRGAPWAMVFTTDGNESHYVETSLPLAPKRADWIANRNVFFSVNGLSRRRSGGQSSRNEDVCAVNALLAEFDGKDFRREDEWMPLYVRPELEGRTQAAARGALQKAQTQAVDAAFKAEPDKYKQRALAHIASLPQRPSALWCSGGGYQALWLLDETIQVTDANRKEVAAVYRKWVAYVGGDPAASDLRRLLRVPGSRNWKRKYGAGGLPVEFVWCDLDRVYNLSDLKALLPAAVPSRAAHRTFIPAGVELAGAGEVPDLPNHPAIRRYDRETDLHGMLLEIGYTDEANGRMSRPGADTGGVLLHDDNSATIFSSADPLYCDHRIRPAHVAVVYGFGGDVDAFLASIGGLDDRLAAAALHQCLKSGGRARLTDLIKAKGVRKRGAEKATGLIVAMAKVAVEQGSLEISVSHRDLEAMDSDITKSTVGRLTCDLVKADIIKSIAPGGYDGPGSYDLNPLLATLGVQPLQALPEPQAAVFDEDGVAVSADIIENHQSHDAFGSGRRPARGRYERDVRGSAADTMQFHRAFGTAGLFVTDVLLSCDSEFGMSRRELDDAESLSPATVARVTGDMEAWGLLLEVSTSGRAKRYIVSPAWERQLDEIAPGLTSYGNSLRRAIKRSRDQANRLAYFGLKAQSRGDEQRGLDLLACADELKFMVGQLELQAQEQGVGLRQVWYPGERPARKGRGLRYDNRERLAVAEPLREAMFEIFGDLPMEERIARALDAGYTREDIDEAIWAQSTPLRGRYMRHDQEPNDEPANEVDRAPVAVQMMLQEVS